MYIINDINSDIKSIYGFCVMRTKSTILFTVDLPHPYNKIGDGPEGPEVRTVCDKIRPILLNRVITNAYKGERGQSIGFENLVFPSTITAVHSYGKKILIYTSSDQVIVVSLGMTGRLQYYPGDHSHIYFDINEYENKGPFRVVRPICKLYFDDYRYMGSVNIIPINYLQSHLSGIGPDLLAAALDEKKWISSETWLAIFTQKKIQKWAICKALLDQSLVSGIGNYLLSEILYYAGILPERKINTITLEEWETLRVVAHKIILLSYSHGGFTIKDFISPDGAKGMYPAAVYGKKIDPYGNPVVSAKTSNGRTSHWVPAVQH